MRLHPAFYVKRFKVYLPADLSTNFPYHSVSAHSPTPFDGNVDDDWDRILLDLVQAIAGFEAAPMKKA